MLGNWENEYVSRDPTIWNWENFNGIDKNNNFFSLPIGFWYAFHLQMSFWLFSKVLFCSYVCKLIWDPNVQISSTLQNQTQLLICSYLCMCYLLISIQNNFFRLLNLRWQLFYEIDRNVTVLKTLFAKFANQFSRIHCTFVVHRTWWTLYNKVSCSNRNLLLDWLFES